MRASVAWIAALIEGSAPSTTRMAKLLTASGTEIEATKRDEHGTHLEAAVTSNRPDLLSHRGLAREVAALTGASLKPVPPVCAGTGPEVPVTVRVDDAASTPRYTAHMVRGIKNVASPAWMQERLLAAGQRPINAVVDVTNYILLEDGQPLHAFDLGRIAAATICVRRARSGEKLPALNGRTLDLHTDDLVIADAERPQALAGVMGGSLSEVGATTTDILIESARFAPRLVRAAARRHQLRTDSSHRFERGVDDNAVLAAGLRAAQLIAEITGGVVAGNVVDLGAPVRAPAGITFDPASVRRVTGASVARPRMRALLERLGCTVEESSAGWNVTPPTWRRDLSRPIDLVEEVMRLVGIDKVPERLGMPLAVASVPSLRRLRAEVQDLCAALGAHETITPDFVGEGAAADVDLFGTGASLSVASPVRTGEAVLRRSLLPSLLRVARFNQDQDNGTPRFFEVGAINAAGKDGQPARRVLLGVLLYGDWRLARAWLDAVLALRNVVPEPVASANDAFSSASRAGFSANGATLACMGEPAAALLEGLRTRPIYIEVDLAALDAAGSPVRRFKGLPRFPSMVRDLALKVQDSVSFGSISATARGAATARLESLELVEVFRGAQIGQGMKSLNIRLTFRDEASTLTGAAVDAEMAAIVLALGTAVGAEVRGA